MFQCHQGQDSGSWSCLATSFISAFTTDGSSTIETAKLWRKSTSLKYFRLDLSRFGRCLKTMTSTLTRLSLQHESMQVPKRGQITQLPHENQQYDTREWLLPISVTNGHICKQCFKKDDLYRTCWICIICKVTLCMSDARNCFVAFHALPEKTPSFSPSHSVSSSASCSASPSANPSSFPS